MFGCGSGFFWQRQKIPEIKRINHKIRVAYGYTDEQILDYIYKYGDEWAIDAYRLIMEDEEANWQLLLALLPAARTAMDKKSGKAMQKWTSRIRKELSRMMTPWVEKERIERIRERLSKPPEGAVYDESGQKVDLNEPGWWNK